VVGDGASRRRPRGAQSRAAFWQRYPVPHTRAAERLRATGGRTGELRQDWQGAFVVTHIGRAGLILQGAHQTTDLLTTAAP
jgi:hypothetical protein